MSEQDKKKAEEITSKVSTDFAQESICDASFIELKSDITAALTDREAAVWDAAIEIAKTPGPNNEPYGTRQSIVIRLEAAKDGR